MDYREFISQMELEWDEGGFFEQIRNGNYDEVKANNILDLFNGLEASGLDFLPRRLVSLIWYLPIFLNWQVERVIERGGDAAAFEKFRAEIISVLQEVLGVP